MKLAVIALLFAQAMAFAPSRPLMARPAIALFGRVDSSEMIEAALAASKEFGPTSKEARVAWDQVEEMDASDNSAAYAPMVDDKDYEEKLSQLTAIMKEQLSKVEQVKFLAQEIKAIKLSSGSTTKSPQTDQMRDSLQEAKAATEEHGIDSPQARTAWETVEEIASSDSSVATQPTLDEECLIETIAACEALEVLGNALP